MGARGLPPEPDRSGEKGHRAISVSAPVLSATYHAAGCGLGRGGGGKRAGSAWATGEVVGSGLLGPHTLQ